jgi:hypothetical protein
MILDACLANWKPISGKELALRSPPSRGIKASLPPDGWVCVSSPGCSPNELHAVEWLPLISLSMTAKPMPPWISGICLQDGLAKQYELDLGEKGEENAADAGSSRQLALDGLAPITIFVGANNSGKSRLMRELFCLESFFGLKLSARIPETGIQDLGACIKEVISYVGNVQFFLHGDGWILGRDDAKRGEPSIGIVNSYLSSIKEEISGVIHPGRREGLVYRRQQLQNIGLESGLRPYKHIRRCYVPMLRGMRPPVVPGDRAASQADHEGADCFEQRTKYDYFRPGAQGDPLGWDRDNTIARVFTGLSLYADLRRRLLGRTQELRNSVREYEAYLSDNFFGSRPLTLIPVEEGDNDVVHIKIGDDDEYPIHKLGDGLQGLIICTYPIFTEVVPGSLFFLEEPDIGMHPSLQRSLLAVLKQQHLAKGHQFFLTTHSNHLLDLLEDDGLVSIFTFSEHEVAESPIDLGASGGTSGEVPVQPRLRIRRSSNRDRDVLMQLGVRLSASYLANATIWVEGISDCAYLRAYMEAFRHYLESRGGDWGRRLADRLKTYKEDRHYAFVEYNGSNLAHFDFSVAQSAATDQEENLRPKGTIHTPSLCARAIVLADGDIGIRVERYKNFAEQLGERFIKLPGKEIENLIPPELLKCQITHDHTTPCKGSLENVDLNMIDYAGYGHSEVGLGRYLADTVGIDKYKGVSSGTLPDRYKARWRSDYEGVPFRIRNAIEDARNGAERQDLENSCGSPSLPEYLTQDIVWLCVLLFAHVADANHDHAVADSLREFQESIVRTSTTDLQGSASASVATAPVAQDTPAPAYPPDWPLRLSGDPNEPSQGQSTSTPRYRECLLARFKEVMLRSDAYSGVQKAGSTPAGDSPTTCFSAAATAQPPD